VKDSPELSVTIRVFMKNQRKDGPSLMADTFCGVAIQIQPWGVNTPGGLSADDATMWPHPRLPPA
jgi:hypothetical protein